MREAVVVSTARTVLRGERGGNAPDLPDTMCVGGGMGVTGLFEVAQGTEFLSEENQKLS